MPMSVPNFLIWHCAGCGAPADGKKKPCDCPTNVGTRSGPNGRRERTWWDYFPSTDAIERGAQAAYEAALANSKHQEDTPAWERVGDEQRKNWRRISAAVLATADPAKGK